MATPQTSATPAKTVSGFSLAPVAHFNRMRALAWHENVLYASRGYALLRAKIDESSAHIQWEPVARYSPQLWRTISSQLPLTFRFFRDGFHALAILSSGHLVAAVPQAIVSLAPGEARFRVSHRVLRGTRPLHIAVTPRDHIFWGEYFDNGSRDAVHIYASTDRGESWNVAFTFDKGSIRHVHNIVYDQWENCLWILTGDKGAECRILRASCDFSQVETVLAGNQQARAVALVPAESGLYFSSDTPFEANHIYCLDRRGNLNELAALSSSSIYGCAVGDALFFSTMVEPSEANPDQDVRIFGSLDGNQWPQVLHWKKDLWPMGLFQYGNALFPDGHNTSGVLAASTVAVKSGDLQTGLWRVSR